MTVRCPYRGEVLTGHQLLAWFKSNRDAFSKRATSAAMASALRRQANVVSVMSRAKCLAILYLPMTLPARRAMVSLRSSRHFVRSVAATTGASSASVKMGVVPG